MAGIPTLISDLAVILISASIVSLLFKRLKQPVVLGYIVAGILAGPSVSLIPTITETESIKIWGEIGVIFLLFTLGLDFSLKKLMKVGGTAIIGAVTIVIGMMSTGYMLGSWLGWGEMNSLFLGGMLSMSSTTIIFKAFDDMGLRNKKFANVVFGILIVEDLFAVLLMVLLSTIAVSKEVEGLNLLFSVIKLGVFLLFCFIIGIYILPSFLKHNHKYLNGETLLILSIGLCLMMVLIASKSGFSLALGAFLIGSILAETIEAERIEQITKPVKDLFGAIFFVSVGMLIQPELLWQYKYSILIITFVVMIGQLFFSSFGIILSGQPLRTALQAGFSLTQIGEFAFIIASLGLSLGVTDHYLYPIVVAVSIITTFFTPYMIKLSEPTCVWIEKIIPEKMFNFLSKYSMGSNTIRQQNTWHKLLKALLRIVATYSSISLVFVFLWLQWISPIITKQIIAPYGNIISLSLILIIISPMLRAIMMKKNHSEEFVTLWQDKKYNRGPLISLILLRILLCTIIILIPISRLFNLTFGVMLALAFLIIGIIMYSQNLKKHSILMEKHFFQNLSAREKEIKEKSPVSEKFVNSMLERDLHLAEFEVSPNSPSIGKTLKQLQFRQKCNVNIVTIIRGHKHINIPSGNERLFPFDKIIVTASDKDIETFTNHIEEQKKEIKIPSYEDVKIEQITIDSKSNLLGKNLIQSNIQTLYECLVIGIERGDGSIKNPPPETILQEDDLVWIVGEHNKIELLNNY